MNNHIFIAMIAMSLIISFIGLQSAFADVIPPKKQMKLSFSSDEIICKEGFIRITNANDDHPACVKISSVNKLVKFGWAHPLNDAFLAMRSSVELQSVGTVKIVDKVKVYGESRKLDPTPRIIGYNIVLEACATSTVRAPEVVVISDSEIRRVNLSERIEANTCQTTTVQIKSANLESIKAILTNKGGVFEKITSLENKINGLMENLVSEKAKLSSITTNTITDETSEASQKIIKLRNEITKSKDELNRYKLALYVKPAQISDLTPKSYLQSPIDGSSITKLSVHKSTIQPKTQPKDVLTYNTIFQICAKDTTIHIPEVLVISDIETKSVKLSNDIYPNSCQRSSVEISTEKPQSISITLKNKGEISSLIDNLEKKVSDLQEKIKIEKQHLEILIHQTPRPLDYVRTVNTLTENIEQLRNELNLAKVNLYYLLGR